MLTKRLTLAELMSAHHLLPAYMCTYMPVSTIKAAAYSILLAVHSIPADVCQVQIKHVQVCTVARVLLSEHL